MKASKPSIGTGRRGVIKAPNLFDRDRDKRVAQPEQRKFYGGDASILSYEEAIRRATESNFDPAVVGKALMALAQRSQGVELAISFAAFIATRGQISSLRSAASKAAPRQDVIAPTPRVPEDFAIDIQAVDDRALVTVRNVGDTETFKGQILRLANVEGLRTPLPWTIRWKDRDSETVLIERGKHEVLELARIRPSAPSTSDGRKHQRTIVDFLTPTAVFEAKVAAPERDDVGRAVEAVVRITTNNAKRSKSVTVALTVLNPWQLTAAVLG